jgi:protein phosphatase
MNIVIPEFCLVAIMGASPERRSVFIAHHFAAEEVVAFGSGSGGEASLSGVCGAVAERLAARQLVVVDLGQRPKEDRSALVHLAKLHHALPVAIVMAPEDGRASLPRLDREGFRAVHVLDTDAALVAATVERQRVATDARHIAGPYDIIGDIHGCAVELKVLLAKLGYDLIWYRDEDGESQVRVDPPPGRRAVFLGDLTDRGLQSPDVLRIVMSLVAAGDGLCVLGNHDAKLLRWLEGRSVRPTHGLDRTIDQMEAESNDFRRSVHDFVAGLPSHYWLDGGRLVVVHAGIRADMIGRVSGAVREYCLYGETTGEIDRFGYPVRADWAAGYEGDVTVVYGHTPVHLVGWVGKTICIDTGCVFGGTLTALRWPEREIVSVPAGDTYFEPKGQLPGKTRARQP